MPAGRSTFITNTVETLQKPGGGTANVEVTIQRTMNGTEAPTAKAEK